MHTGLTGAEAAARLKSYGANALPGAKRRTLGRIALEALREPLLLLLVAASLIYFALGDIHEAALLTGLACANIGLIVYQEQIQQAAQMLLFPGLTFFVWLAFLFEWLERAIDGRDPLVMPIKTYPYLEPVLRVSALAHSDQKFAGVISNRARHLKRVAQVGMAALIDRAGQPNSWLHREQHTWPANLRSRVVHPERHAASLSALYS